ncbi:hypothetical protein [Ancylobacter sp. G4_0304]|uniref:hypothetical protein n=1 Tax=Ancylobacter sp. G4_0304 TaxID=3114289 RepID=UPI0039C6E6E5
MRAAAIAVLFFWMSSQALAFEELPINFMYCSDTSEKADCKKNVQRMEDDNKRAWKGDYAGQRNVAYCLSSGCGGLVIQNKALGCAWRIVIIGSGSPKVDAGDISNIKYECGRLDAAEASAAKAQAATIYRTVFKRELPAVAW